MSLHKRNSNPECYTCKLYQELLWWLSGKESACDAETRVDAGSLPDSGRSPGEGNGNLFRYSCLENPMDRGAWRVTVHGGLKGVWTWLSNSVTTKLYQTLKEKAILILQKFLQILKEGISHTSFRRLVRCWVAQLCLTLCNPMDCSLPGSSVLGDSPGKNTGVGCHAFLQEIFPTQESNLCLLNSLLIGPAGKPFRRLI